MASSVCRYLGKNEEQEEVKEVISYQIILEQSATDGEISDTESIGSFQANTTVSAKDSSDISTDEVSEYYMSEYELVSSPDTLEPSVFDKDTFSSSSCPRDTSIHLQPSYSDDSDVTDVSENELYDSDYLGMLPDNKFYHTCAQCFSYNLNPAFRFCDSCFQERKEFYPSKPSRKNKRKNANPTEPLAKKLKTDASDDVPESSSTPIESSSTPIESSGTTTENSSESPFSEPVLSTQDSGFESLSPSAEWELKETKDKCLTCLSENVNGIFLHGKTCHRCCCYKCSKKIWHETRRCPMCRRKIHNVCLLLNC